MEDVKVYHSIWKYSFLILVFFAFSIGLFWTLDYRSGYNWILWLGILFSAGGGVIFLYMIFIERILHQPFFTITDNGIIMNTIKKYEIEFSNVKDFSLSEIKAGGFYHIYFKHRFISIHYKKNIERKKYNKASRFGRTIRDFNKFVSGAQEAIPVDGLTIKPQQLCDLLNERLNYYNECQEKQSALP